MWAKKRTVTREDTRTVPASAYGRGHAVGRRCLPRQVPTDQRQGTPASRQQGSNTNRTATTVMLTVVAGRVIQMTLLLGLDEHRWLPELSRSASSTLPWSVLNSARRCEESASSHPKLRRTGRMTLTCTFVSSTKLPGDSSLRTLASRSSSSTSTSQHADNRSVAGEDRSSGPVSFSRVRRVHSLLAMAHSSALRSPPSLAT